MLKHQQTETGCRFISNACLKSQQ